MGSELGGREGGQERFLIRWRTFNAIDFWDERKKKRKSIKKNVKNNFYDF